MNYTAKGLIATELVLEVFKLGGQLVVYGDKLTAPFGLSSARWKILGALDRAPVDALTVPQIARSMGQARQSVQRLVDIMHNDGLLAFNPNPDHKKAKLISLTDNGKALANKMDEQWSAKINDMVDNLPIEELEASLENIRFISKKLDESSLD